MRKTNGHPRASPLRGLRASLAAGAPPGRLLLGLAAGAVALWSLAACGGGGGTSATTKTGSSSTASGGALVAKGKALYTSKGCQSCHSLDGSSGVGPSWKGLAGARVKLADGTTVTADDAYLREAIEAPDKQIVSGYPPKVMSKAIPPGSISPADAAALVAYIKSVR